MNSISIAWSTRGASRREACERHALKSTDMDELKKTPRGSDQGGLSLIEVTIAMAIAAVAVVSLIGLLPQGMSTMRDAGDQAIIARIHQQLLSELQLTPFEDDFGGSLLDALDGLEIYYDSQGEELGDSERGGSGVAGSLEHIYTARIHIPDQGDGAPESVGGASFDGFTFDGTTPNRYVRPVVIEVVAVGGRGEEFEWDDEDNRSMIYTYQTIVVKTGRDFTP